MAEGFNLTTYYAKRIIGDTAAANAEKALLQTGDDITADTWILHRTNRTDKLYGIKYKYDSNGHDKMEYYGKASNDNATAWIQFDTGDASFNNILGKIYVTATSLPESNNIIYYLTYTDNATSGHQDIKNSNRLYIYEDTTSTYFNVGSSSTSGGITIHNANGNYSNIISSAFSTDRTVTLPNEDGTFALLTKTDINALINLLDTGTSVLTGDDYIITQYVGGGTTTTTYHRRMAKNVRVGGLTTARSLWGNSFDGTADISGNFVMKNNSNRYHRFTIKQNGTDNTVGEMYYDSGNATNVTSGRWSWEEWSPNSTNNTGTTGFYEVYRLPVVNTGLTANASYDIRTSKSGAYDITGNAATATSTSRLTLISSNTASTSTNTYATNGLNVRWFSETGKLPGQPSQWGFLLTVGTGDSAAENHQIFIQQADGSLYHRGTNSSSYTSPPDFKILIDGNNWYKQIFANKNISRSTLTVYDSTWAVTSGTDVFGLSFKDTGLTYTPSGGSATASSDTGDWRMWLTCAAASNTVQLNMRIDGQMEANTFKAYSTITADSYIYTSSYLQANTHAYLNTGHVYMKYNNTWYSVLHNHGNGNISVESASGGLYIGYANTTLVNWMNGRMELRDGCLSLFPNNTNYREGLRIHSISDWSDIILCGNDNTGNTGTSANSWLIGNNNGNFHISKNTASSIGYCNFSNVDGYWRLRGDYAASVSGKYRSILHIYGQTYGNTAAELASGTAGLLSFGDGGPQITFDTSAVPGGGQGGALLFTDHDTCATGASFHFLSNQSDWNVISKRFHARTSISIGTNLPSTSYNLSVTGTSYFSSTATLGGDLLFSNSATTTRQIRGIVGDNDYWRIAGGATAANGGWMEIATADDGNEPIYVRQYTGAYTTITRTATLLDSSGNTSFPGQVSCVGRSTTDTTAANYFHTGGIQIYESNLVGNTQDNFAYAPRIGFHWRNRIAATLSFHKDGIFYFRSQNGTSRATVDANLSGIISRAGVAKSWYQGRDSAIIKTTSYSGYDAILSMKTTAGDWALGVYNDNIMYFTYILDSNYSSNSNTVTKQFIFNPNGTLTATTFSGALSGNATTSSGVLDCGNTSKTTTFAYSKAGLAYADYTWLAAWNGYELRAVNKSQFAQASHSHSYLPLAGGIMTGAINFNNKGACSIYNGPNDNAYGAGGALNNLVISSWYGISFTTSCTGQTYTNTNAVSINCRNGNMYAARFNGPLTGNVTGNCSGSSGSCTGNSNTANYQNCVQTNEIRYARNGNMTSANDLWQGWAFAEGKVAVINGWRFGNGNGALAPIYGSKVYNAIWNDFAEYRESDVFEGGRVLVSDGHGKLVLATERLQPAARVISDTFGCSVGQSDKAKTPIGVAGRVLVYPYQDRNNYKVGDCLCAAPNGTADIMTREEIINYPDRIIGIVDEIPTYEVWQQSLTNYKKKDNGEIDEIGEKNTTDTKVNGRIWIYVR